MSNFELAIRPAQADDVDAIHSLAESWLLSNVENPAEQGFLISNYPKEKYHQYLESAEYFWVAELDGELAGFLLAYHCDSIAGDEVVNSLLKYTSLEPFTLIKQICSAAGTRGVANGLYRALFKAMNTDYALAAVVNEPANTRSVEFHRRLGFQHLWEVKPPADFDGQTRSRSIWCYGKSGSVMPTRIIRASESEMVKQLIEKEETFTYLYMHEDNLNWTKLGMLLTLMTAFVTLFAVLIERADSLTGDLSIPIMALIFGGLIVNFMFLQKLRSGARFMQGHKDNLIAIDADIRRINPMFRPIFDPITAKASFTVRWMGWIPILSTLTWSACSIVLFIEFCL